MGDQQISPLTSASRTQFMRHLLCDIEALEEMINNGLIEKGVTRIGAEQEFCLIGKDLRPSMTGPVLLSEIDEPHFTSELARWNLEINLDPQDTGAGCLKRMHDQLRQLLRLAQEKAGAAGCDVVLTGILPTIRKGDLVFDNLTPHRRYRILADILRDLRGEDFALRLEGVDELSLKHDSILFEACNTSFQVHLQIDPDEFADRYNWAQVLAGPVLAACANSPMLLGKELWSETRIGLFQQSIEVRSAGGYQRDNMPRVSFGNNWLRSSAAEIFKNDISQYQLIVGAELSGDNATKTLGRQETPELRALNLHNGTIYKWNRACYGIGHGKPHLRIENRYLPAGPTPVDEMANTTFWIGLMHAMPSNWTGEWDRHFYFQDVRSNFLKAARNGLSTEMRWFGKFLPTDRLILDQLIPMAESGLNALGIPSAESQPYLEIIEHRIRKKQTGSRWIINSLRALRTRHSVEDSMLLITQYMQEHSLGDLPVHHWETPDQKKLKHIPNLHRRVDSIMITNLVTIREDDLVDFAAKLMEWNSLHHLPVENPRGELSGVVSAKDIARFRSANPRQTDAIVADCMTSDVITVTPESLLEVAERIMLKNEFGSMPVVHHKHVVGIITANDIRRLQGSAENR